MPRINVRPSSYTDAEYIYALSELTLRPYVEALGKRWSVAKMQAKCAADAVDPNYSIIQVKGLDCGALHMEVAVAEIWLHTLLLHPRYQQRGIGTLLMRKVLAQGSELSVPVHLYVTKANPARMFYEKLGFTVREENELHFRMQSAA